MEAPLGRKQKKVIRTLIELTDGIPGTPEAISQTAGDITPEEASHILNTLKRMKGAD